MLEQSPFRAIFQITSLSNKTKLPMIKEEWRSQTIEPVNVLGNDSEHMHSSNPYLLDLKKEWSALSDMDTKLLLQQELYGPEWHHIWAENISKSLDQFKIDWEQLSENCKDDIGKSREELAILSNPMDTLKWRRKRQRLTFHERLLIYTKFKKEGMEIRQLCSEFQIWRATVLQISWEFKEGRTHWSRTKN